MIGQWLRRNGKMLDPSTPWLISYSSKLEEFAKENMLCRIFI
jgi:hypothetical protein